MKEGDEGEGGEAEHGKDADGGLSFGDTVGGPDDTGGIGNACITVGEDRGEDKGEADHGVENDGLQIVATGGRVCWCRRRGANAKHEGERLEDEIDGEEPAEEVGEGDAEVASAVLPDPKVMDGGEGGIETEIPGDHEKRGNQGDGACGEPPFFIGDLTQEDGGEDPGEIAGGEIGGANEDGDKKEFGAKRCGIDIVAEGEAGEDTHIFQEVTDEQAKYEKGEDPTPAIASGSVKQGKEDGEQEYQGNGKGERKDIIGNGGSAVEDK